MIIHMIVVVISVGESRRLAIGGFWLLLTHT